MAQNVFYDKTAVRLTVNPTQGVNALSEVLLASDCSISFNSSQAPLYSIGTKGSLGQFPTAARAGDVSFNFLTTITGVHASQKGNIVNYLASGIKNSINSLASGVRIEFAGVTGTGFLNSYSFNVASNSVSSSSASFTFFGSGSNAPVEGFLKSSNYAPYAATGKLATGIAHGRFTDIGTPFQTIIGRGNPIGGADNPQTGTVYGADYSISFNHNPVYKIGQEFPTCTYYTTASESVNVTEDLFNPDLPFSGENAQDAIITLKGLNATKTMQVGMSGAKSINSSMSVGLDDIVRTQKTLTAAY